MLSKVISLVFSCGKASSSYEHFETLFFGQENRKMSSKRCWAIVNFTQNDPYYTNKKQALDATELIDKGQIKAK